jgi:CBS domain-containing protein
MGGEINLDQTTAEKLLSRNLPSIQVTRTSHEAYDMMGDLGVRHLVICDGDTIVGMVSMRDLLEYFKSFEPKIAVD